MTTMTGRTGYAEQYADVVSATIGAVMGAVREGSQVEDQDAVEWLWGWPLYIVDRRGSQFAVVLAVGGPDVRVVCDLDDDGDRWGSAELVVTWGSGVARRCGTHVDECADFFAEAQ